jgi:hypothetical protein
MRVTIIPTDGFVSVDGEGYGNIDLSFMASDIHALQWYETEGELEIKDARGRIVENRKIDSLEPYQPALDAWQVAKEVAKEVANQPLLPDDQTGQNTPIQE